MAEEDYNQQFYIAKRNFLTVTTIMAVIVIGGVKLDSFSLFGVNITASRSYMLLMFLALVGYYMYRRFKTYRYIIQLTDVKRSVEEDLNNSKAIKARYLSQAQIEKDEQLIRLCNVRSTEEKQDSDDEYKYHVQLTLALRTDVGPNTKEEFEKYKQVDDILKDDDIIRTVAVNLDPQEVLQRKKEITESYMNQRPHFIDGDLPVIYFWITFVSFVGYTIGYVVSAIYNCYNNYIILKYIATLCIYLVQQSHLCKYLCQLPNLQ